MSQDIKESIIMAGVITAIIAILGIIFGNTGSGFFRNLMVFIVGTIIGTPIAIIGKFLTSLFSDNELYKYGSFILGALIGVNLATSFFSNKLETTYMYQCVRGGLSKSQCECMYGKLEDRYDESLKSILSSRNLNRDVQDFISKSTTECERR